MIALVGPSLSVINLNLNDLLDYAGGFNVRSL